MYPVAILAGGLATRLRPVTQTMPKALAPAAGEPFIAHQLRLLARAGVERVVLCLGYLGEQVEEFVGNGAEFGLEIVYSFDGPKLLGTGGALKQAAPLLGQDFFVLYGDSYLDIAYADVAANYAAAGTPALMTVFRNEGRWDTSNVVFNDGRVRVYDKKHKLPDMAYIDYGLGVLSAAVLEEYAQRGAFDLADVYCDLAARGRLAGYEVFERFYEVGTPESLREFEDYMRNRQ